MSSLDNREKGFEKKFANDQEQEFRAMARRNRMLGEWAAGLMGLQNVADYAQAVVKSDFEQPGDEVDRIGRGEPEPSVARLAEVCAVGELVAPAEAPPMPPPAAGAANPEP